MSTQLSQHRERDFQELFLEAARNLSEREIYEMLRDMARERIRECEEMTARTNKILGRDLKERWAA